MSNWGEDAIQLPNEASRCNSTNRGETNKSLLQGFLSYWSIRTRVKSGMRGRGGGLLIPLAVCLWRFGGDSSYGTFVGNIRPCCRQGYSIPTGDRSYGRCLGCCTGSDGWDLSKSISLRCCNWPIGVCGIRSLLVVPCAKLLSGRRAYRAASTIRAQPPHAASYDGRTAMICVWLGFDIREQP